MRKDWYDIINSFSNLNVLVVGDVMIDEYLVGEVDRISPEAPVPVINIKERKHKLGGASNVALNCKALGANPILCGITGTDSNGILFGELLQEHGLTNLGTIASNSRKTTCKTRIVSNNQQMLRVDFEDTNDLNEEEENHLLERVEQIIKEGTDLIILEDYDKGCLSKSVIERIEKLAYENSVFIAVDPKKKNFSSYKMVHLFKPNLKELMEGLNTRIDPLNTQSIERALQLLNPDLQKSLHLITLSKHGVFYKDTSNDSGRLNAEIRNISDVSGAGDTVISVASLAIKSGCSLKEAAWLSNLAGGYVCEKPGVEPIKAEELKEEIKRLGYGS